MKFRDLSINCSLLIQISRLIDDLIHLYEDRVRDTTSRRNPEGTLLLLLLIEELPVVLLYYYSTSSVPSGFSP